MRAAENSDRRAAFTRRNDPTLACIFWGLLNMPKNRCGYFRFAGDKIFIQKHLGLKGRYLTKAGVLYNFT